MKRNKIWIAMLCVAMMVCTFNLPAYANSKSATFKISAPGNTVNMTQNDYLAETKKAISQSTSDDRRIEAICETFLTLAKASVRDPKSYDSTQLIAADSLKNAKVQYRLTDYEYQSALNNALDWKISQDNLSFTDFKVQKKSENSAVASVVESYTYQINDGFNQQSFRRKMYTFELLSGSDGWKITNVTTDDPWEKDAKFTYAPIDVKSAVNAHLAETAVKSTTSLINETKDVKVASQLSPNLALRSYNTSNAVSYAAAHYRDTSNSVFGYNSTHDCQNFASQCVWAGLGGTGTDKTARPAVPTSLVGTSAFNVWCADQSTTYYSYFAYNWAWNNVQGFAKLVYASTPSAAGPYGYTYYTQGVQTASVGDVLTVDWSGAPAADTLDHAMFVTGVNGTAGSRTKDNVMIAAHTSPTNSAYMTLSSYTSQSIGSFGKDSVVCGYY